MTKLVPSQREQLHLPIEMDAASQEELATKLAYARDHIHAPSNKAEVVAMYQRLYPNKGKGGWKQQLVHDLSVLTGMKPKNLEKRFDPQRLNNEEKKNTSQYKELGERMKFAGKKARVTVTAWITFSEGPAVRKDFTRVLTRDRTTRLLREGGPEAIFEQYGINPDNIDYMEDLTVDIDFID